MTSGVAVAVLLVALAAAPSAREFFGLRLGPALALLGLAFSTLFVSDRLEVRGAFSTGERGAATLFVGFLMQLFASGLVALTSPPGTFAMAAFPILTAWNHLGLLRSGPRQPFATLTHGAAMASVAAVAPDPVHPALLAAVALLGLGGGTLLGMLSSWGADADARLYAHRSALAAQSLAAFAADLEEVEETLAQVAREEGETRRTLERARRACRGLATASAALAAEDPLREGVARAGAALERAARLLEPAPPSLAVRAADPGAPIAVAVLPVARAALASATRRFPRLAWSCTPEAPTPDALFAQLQGGPDALRAMLDPLLANAAEGDGAFGASSVDLRALCDAASGEIEIDVCDDGPGFPAHLLARPIALLGTTKHGGSGLGLYTVERLARGCGGTLARENRPEGGAQVRLRLPGAALRAARGGNTA
jgi:signal transduction histidine kinase